MFMKEGGDCDETPVKVPEIPNPFGFDDYYEKRCAINKEGIFIPENQKNCCCCIPLKFGLYVITVFQFLAGLNAFSVLIALLNGNAGAAILLMIAVAPLVWGSLLVLRFWCNGDDKELPIYIS